MSVGDNMMDLALRITADPSQGEKAIDEFTGRVKSAADQVQSTDSASVAGAERMAAAQASAADQVALLRRQYAGLAEDAAKLEAQPFLSAGEAEGLRVDRELMGQIRTEAQGLGAELSEGGSVGAGIRRSMNELFLFRRALSATVGLAALGFYISEWGRVAEAIKNAALSLGGFDEELRTVEEDARKASEAALTSFGQLDAATRLRLSLVADSNARSKETLQLEVQRTEQQMRDIRGQIESVNRLRDAKRELHAVELEMSAQGQSGLFVSPELAQKQVDLMKQIEGLTSQLGPKLSGDLGKAAAQLADDVDKGNKALTNFQVQLNELNEKPERAASSIDKFAASQQHLDDVIATAQAKLPPYIVEIDKLRAAIAQQESGFAGTVQILKQYQELLREGFPSPAQLGFAPSSQNAEAGIQEAIRMEKEIRGWGDEVTKLTEAQRQALPTERELALANAELAREYPNLTAAERREWAQIMLTSDAYRKHIDTARQVHSTNAQLASSFTALSIQVRTAFSEMAGQITGWGGVATRVFDQVFNAVARQIEIEKVQAAEHQISQFSMVKATLDGFKQLAPVKAIIDTAKGVEALASLDFGAAAEWFAAAALWGTVAAFQVASMVGAFQPGTSGSTAVASAGAANASTSTQSHTLASGSASAQAAQQNSQQPVVLQVHFNGPVYGGPSGVQELMDKFNDAVNTHRMKLVASHTLFGRSLA